MPTSKTRVARLDVPDDGQSRLAAAPAAGQQQVAVAAELEDVDRPLGEREHADQVVVGRAIEEHLLVPGDRHQRGPGAGRQRHHGAGLACGARTARWSDPRGMAGAPGRLAHARTGSSLNSNFGFALTIATLPEFSSAPPSIHLRITVNLGVGDLRRLGGHLRLFCVGDDQEQRAVLGVARLDHLARAAPLHAVAVVVEVEAALRLSGLWQRPASAAEDPAHVVLEGHLLLGRHRRRRPTGAGRHDDEQARQDERRAVCIELRSHGWRFFIVRDAVIDRLSMADTHLEDSERSPILEKLVARLMNQ